MNTNCGIFSIKYLNIKKTMHSKFITELNPDCFYHIFNHSNGKENIFKLQDEYNIFLEKFKQYISPIAETFSYCLMPNHFHFLIKIKEKDDLLLLFKINPILLSTCQVEKIIQIKLSQQFSNFFNSYTKKHNLRNERKGSLFCRPFKRKEITSTSYLIDLVNYIHNNPVHHLLVETPYDWQHSSFHAFNCNKKTSLQKQAVLEWFGGYNSFLEVHKTIEAKYNEISFDIWE